MRDVADASGLAESIRRCDPASWAVLYDRYAPRMYRYVYRRVGDAACAEDLTSEVFLRLVQAVRDGQEWNHSLEAWLYRVAHNLVVDYYRRRSGAVVQPLDETAAAIEGNPVAATETALTNQRLRAALLQLTPEQQEVLVLRYGEGLTAKQVGAVVDKTTGAVEALQRRGLAAIRRLLLAEPGGRGSWNAL